MELAYLQTPWNNDKVTERNTFIDVLDDEQGDALSPRAMSDPGVVAQSFCNPPNDNDFRIKTQSTCTHSRQSSLDTESTCIGAPDTSDDETMSLSSYRSPPNDSITSESANDFEVRPALLAAPPVVYGVFFVVFVPCQQQAMYPVQAFTPCDSTPNQAEPTLDGVCIRTPMGRATDENVDATTKHTTITFKNLPADCSLSNVLETLDNEGFSGCYDFVHAPVDFTSGASMGYVHVNLLDCTLSERAGQHFQGFNKWVGCCNACDVAGCIADWRTVHSGLEALIERYRNSPLMHESVPDEHKPALFSNGKRVSFPAPTIRLKPPRVRHHKRSAVTSDQS